MNVNTLSVYLTKTNKLGTLATKNKKIYFEYDKEFLKSGIEISPYKLPLKAGLFECNDDTFDYLWGVFNDSLPDGWGRLLIDRHFISKGINPSSLTPLDRLAYVGSNGMGALSYEPEINVDDVCQEDINLDKLFVSSQEVLQGQSDEVIEELLVLGGSSGGARPKVLVQISDDKRQVIHNAHKLQNGFSYWIVKFASSHDNIEIGSIEYAYSLMAKEAGLDMPETTLLSSKKRKYFAVKRFDRDKNKRIHMHSFAGLVHSDFRYPTLDYDDLLSLTLHLTKDMREVKKVFRLAVFNLFTHNRDDHAKNFSFLMNDKKSGGDWSFAPVYDLTFSYGVGAEHSMLYMSEGKNPSIKHLLELSKKHNIKKVDIIIDEVRNAVLKWGEFSDIAKLSKKVSNQIFKEFLI